MGKSAAQKRKLPTGSDFETVAGRKRTEDDRFKSTETETETRRAEEEEDDENLKASVRV
ncbi:hypothetical protein QQ045_032165 [Rhodiola kirilowii]